ncbi:MAG: type I-U CRISPR-associated RAMP protein Csb1/Cas7u [Rhodospirillaceae bacterium]|nr:type I-U CRISPR-associated RAMP protein Csb1/Cas7u [Rhodospirillaceae bacterium]
MSVSINSLVADTRVVALTFRQVLEPVEGPDVPIFPPTYPVAEDNGGHKFNIPYTINETRDGTRICDLDSVQSQANRMEGAFSGALSDVVPRHAVRAGNHPPLPLTELPHRIVDASIRATALGASIREWMLDLESGNPEPLARIAPTSLVYGAWDSRDTQVRLARAVRSEIRAHNISILTRSAQYSGAFPQESLGIGDSEWNRKKGGAAGVGFAPTPSVDAPGGILAHGEIVQSASILLNVLRKYRTSGGSDVLPSYLFGLAMGGLLVGARDYNLRSGCCLVPAGPAEWRSVAVNGERTTVEISESAVLEELHEAARAWGDATGVELGGEAQVHEYDPKAGKAMFGAA